MTLNNDEGKASQSSWSLFLIRREYISLILVRLPPNVCVRERGERGEGGRETSQDGSVPDDSLPLPLFFL